ncbi:hypothetical protein VTK73DRAFT_1701 [Phialemonium thermophilum]|uniref:Uncharacterized protein n=1 Tax=Phialemonium thermophilum TaxID=223376 RepID=A0ABR3X7Z3_9PEZI
MGNTKRQKIPSNELRSFRHVTSNPRPGPNLRVTCKYQMPGWWGGGMSWGSIGCYPKTSLHPCETQTGGRKVLSFRALLLHEGASSKRRTMVSARYTPSCHIFFFFGEPNKTPSHLDPREIQRSWCFEYSKGKGNKNTNAAGS